MQEMYEWFFSDKNAHYDPKEAHNLMKMFEENGFKEFEWKYIHNAVTWQYSSNLADYELERNFLPKGVSMVTASTVNSRFQDSVSEVKEQVIDYLNAKPSAKLGLVIADALYGLGKEKWDSPSDMWKAKEFEEVIDFLKVRESF